MIVYNFQMKLEPLGLSALLGYSYTWGSYYL
jgi:hypothetical protein